MADPVTVSPTGAAILGQSLIKFAVPFFGVIGLLAGLPDTLAASGVVLPAWPWLAIVFGVAKALLGLGVALGIASQGARKPNDAAQAAGVAAAATPGAGAIGG